MSKNTDELEEIIGDNKAAEKIEEIIEKKVSKRVIEQKEKKKENTVKEEKISRRSFLKKLGAGALGLGAASILPYTMAVDIDDSDGLTVYSDNDNEILDVNDSGPIDVNTNMNIENNKINTSNFEITENSSTNSLDFNYTG